ncbi:uncharacterized protein LOC129966491 [Argiope bruennichi]|uniref:uncharacterized protein LOC129966491 n=1 Tax=Argiope bruennichi TaxID=94029 RepID=UPI002495839D|nr:uncharacterized protein LOC129966491 [Argiope bruennichi]
MIWTSADVTEPFTRTFVFSRIKHYSIDSFCASTRLRITVEKAISESLGDVPSVRKLRSGDLLVQVNTRKQAQTILKIDNLGSIPVTVSAHNTLNFSRGVISCGELFHTPIEEITQKLRSQGVTNVRRITIRKDGQLLDTKHLVLTFHATRIPDSIKAGYMKLAVRHYIPNPLRCFKCQLFGHSKASCRGTLTCARCAEAGHDSSACTAVGKCKNCKGSHASFSRICPTWKFEKEVISEKVTKQITYAEAKRNVKTRLPAPEISYASAVQKTVQTKSTEIVPVVLPSVFVVFQASYIPSETCPKSAEAFINLPSNNTAKETSLSKSGVPDFTDEDTSHVHNYPASKKAEVLATNEEMSTSSAPEDILEYNISEELEETSSDAKDPELLP